MAPLVVKAKGTAYYAICRKNCRKLLSAKPVSKGVSVLP